MKRYIVIAIVAVALVIAGFLVFRKSPNYTKPTAGENIIFFGDSLVEGVGATDGQDLVSKLARATGLDIINAGRSGDTTVTALTRLETDVLARKPKVVIILLGGNDFLRQVPSAQTETSIRTIVEKILTSGSGIILINENKNIGSTPVFRKLAKEKNIPYIENILGGVAGNRQLMSDAIHPNSAGYAILAEKIRPVLEDYLK
jgi:acyl-CoA thioesterase-1